RCGGPVLDLMFSTDRRHLIAAMEDLPVTWFDLETGKPIRRRDPWPNGRPKHADGRAAEAISAIALSPNETVIAFAISTYRPIQDMPGSFASGAGPIRFVDAATRKVIRRFASDREFQSLGYSPDGRTLAAGDISALRALNVADGKVRYDLKDIPGTPAKVVFSPDGLSMALHCCDRCLQIRDVNTGRIIWRRENEVGDDRNGFRPGKSGIVTFFPDGRTLAFAPDAWARQFDSRTGAEQTTSKGHTARIESIGFAPDGRTIRTTAGNQFGSWDVASRRLASLI